MPLQSDSQTPPNEFVDSSQAPREAQPLRAKDLESIQRLLKAAAYRAAAKLYAGAMDCGMREAAAVIKQMRGK